MSGLVCHLFLASDAVLNGTRPSALDWMVDEFGVRVPGTHALDFPTQAIAHRAFYVAVRRNEVKIIPAQVRDYIVVE